MHHALAPLAATVALLMAALPASSATLADDFESYAAGSFPSPTWSDVAPVLPVGAPFVNAPQPSGTVVQTTDAFGQATQAMQTADALGVAKGVYAAVPVSSSYSLVADIRTLRFANSDAAFAGPASDWTMQLTFAQVGVSNFSTTPQAGLYASSLTHTWRFFLIGANGGPLDDVDLGLAASLDTWYTVSLEIDAVAGSFHSTIRDTLSGSLLVDDTHGYANWQANYATFDSIAFFGGETGAFDPAVAGSTTVPSVAQVDNINIQAIPVVPEPGTWALMGLGIGTLGLLARRRRD